MDAIAMQQHLSDKHHEVLPSAVALFDKARMTEPTVFEDALIRIANSVNHDEAVSIATTALLGGV